MNKYDRRQYGLMLRTIEDTELSVQSLGHTISSLEGLLATLTRQEPDWVEKVQTELGDLEQVYAHNLEKKKNFLDPKEIKWITDTLAKLRELVQMRLHEKIQSAED